MAKEKTNSQAPKNNQDTSKETNFSERVIKGGGTNPKPTTAKPDSSTISSQEDTEKE